MERLVQFTWEITLVLKKMLLRNSGVSLEKGKGDLSKRVNMELIFASVVTSLFSPKGLKSNTEYSIMMASGLPQKALNWDIFLCPFKSLSI